MADYTPTSWATALLQLLGMPVTPSNQAAIVSWEAAEGGHWHNPDRYNPLDTTQSAPGAVSTNSAGVKAYTSWDQGLQATAATLQNGMYGNVLAALKNGTSASDVVNAVVGSPWGTKSISLGGQDYTGGGGGGGSTSSAVQAGDASLSDPFGVGALGTSLRRTAISGVFVVGAVGLVVVGLLRGTHAVARTKQAAGRAAGAAGTAAEVAA